MESRTYDVVIVGGGASGLAAAVELKMSSPELDVLVIEKLDEPARKLRATGSGRCNITNTEAAGYGRIMEFFDRIGLVTRAYENGLVYPYSESAADVAELLISRARELGTDISCGESVSSVKKREEACAQLRNTPQAGLDGELQACFCFSNRDKENCEKRFSIESAYKDGRGEHRVITNCDYVVLACGGKAGPNFGTTGDGYRLARELGHSIVTPVPVLTGIECREWDDGVKDKGKSAEYDEPCAINTAGTRSTGEVSLYRKRGGSNSEPSEGVQRDIKPVFREKGEVQFTKYGLSGICVFNMTRHMRFNKSSGESLGDYVIKVDFFPEGNIGDYIRGRKSGAFADEPISELLCTVLKKPLADYVMDRFVSLCLRSDANADAGVFPGDGNLPDTKALRKRPISSLNTRDIRLLCEAVHGMEFHPTGLRGWKDAQATSGGVSMDEIDEETAESKLAAGLYITGELADRDFPCGGFNLSNAWITGLAAADDIASKG